MSNNCFLPLGFFIIRMTEGMIIFDFATPIKTNDDFYVKLKGFVETNSDVEENTIKSAVETSCKNYLKNIKLMDALDLVNAKEATKLIAGLGEISSSVTKLEISTVDAVEFSSSDIEVEIDSDLENQKQNKGLFGRIKGLFGR